VKWEIYANLFIKKDSSKEPIKSEPGKLLTSGQSHDKCNNGL